MNEVGRLGHLELPGAPAIETSRHSVHPQICSSNFGDNSSADWRFLGSSSGRLLASGARKEDTLSSSTSGFLLLVGENHRLSGSAVAYDSLMQRNVRGASNLVFFEKPC